MKIVLFALFALTIPLYTLFTRPAMPYTHDGENHLVRFANYYLAFKEGQLPPRFGPYLYNQYGYPVFNFQYPLANILSLPLRALDVSYILIFKLQVLLALSMGAIGLIAWLRQLTQRTAAIGFALLTYLSTPYLINLIYFRGNIGELWIYGLLPWILFSLLSRYKRFSLTHAAFILVWSAVLLAHNIGSLLVVGVALLWQAYFTIVQKKQAKQRWLNWLWLLIPALGLSLWFWLPALAEMRYTVLSEASNQFDFALHFPTLEQLLFSPVQFGFSYPGGVDSLSFSIGAVTIWSLLLMAAFGLSRCINLIRIPLKNTAVIVFFLIIAVVLVILQLAWTEPIWTLLPFLRFIQFPWRLSLLLSVLMLPIVGWLWVKPSWLLKSVLLLALSVQLTIAWRALPVDWFTKQNIDFEASAITTSTQGENRARDFVYDITQQRNNTPSVLSSEPYTSDVDLWLGSRRRYTISLTQPSIVIEPTMQFPGWVTTVSQIEAGNKLQSPVIVDYINSTEIAGRIAYELKAGTYAVNTTFRQHTLPRYIGNGLFVITGTVLLVLFIIPPVLRLRHDKK